MTYLDHTQTPRLTAHAAKRCMEMGIRTKVVKRMWRNPSQVRLTDGVSHQSDVAMVKSDTARDYAIVVDVSEPRPLVITVLFNVDQPYVRKGATYEIIQEN